MIRINLFNVSLRIIYWIINKNFILLLINLTFLTLNFILWIKNLIIERFYQGNHNYFIYNNLKLRIIIFILRELLLFISLFSNWFNQINFYYDLQIPSFRIYLINPIEIPLLNTLILISSRISLTWSHHSLLNTNYKSIIQNLLITILLGLYFFILQVYEYFNTNFNINDSLYPRIFFLITGFHGLHVILGLIFLLSIIFNSKLMNPNHHFNFERASWYWHFVDFVWLFVFILIY